MQIENLNINDIVFPKRNVRIHTRKQLDEIKRSVEMFGQTRPIIVDEANVVLCGNGLTMAMKELGLNNINVLRKSDLTENQKKKLMIADNKTFSLGLDDIDTLMSFINDMSDDLDIPGYDSDILAGMVAEAEEVTEQIGDFGILSTDEINKMKEAGERKEAKIESLQNQPQGEVSAPINNNINYPNGNENVNTIPSTVNAPINTYESNNINVPEANGELRKSVICPKCGEIIWL